MTSISPQAKVRVELSDQALEIQALHKEVGDPEAGAVLSFIGTVRNNKQGRQVLRIVYEAYPTMALKALNKIAEAMTQQWNVRRVVLAHRVGEVGVGEPSVAIFVATPHRAEGFEALRYAIETLKQDVPIWKKEHFADGEVWVQEGS